MHDPEPGVLSETTRETCTLFLNTETSKGQRHNTYVAVAKLRQTWGGFQLPYQLQQIIQILQAPIFHPQIGMIIISVS